ncbi:MAG: RsmE family RNA methyltransferase [Gemmatimonadota bacterium]
MARGEGGRALGVRSLRPIECARSRSVADAGRSCGFLETLERRCGAALKQCGGAHLPVVHPVRSLERAVADPEPVRTVRLVADPGAPSSLAERASRLDPADAVTYLVGPEGGLDHEERSLCRAAGFERVGLGPRTLRFETAALVGLALLAPRLQPAGANGGARPDPREERPRR